MAWQGAKPLSPMQTLVSPMTTWMAWESWGSFGHEDVKVLGVASHGGEGGCQCGDGHEGGDEGGTHDEE